MCDETKSYLMVQADELSRDAILEAIAQGRFYASQGPRFWIEKKDNSLIVHSTPVKEIVFFTDAVWSDDRATVGECVEEAVYEIQPHETFVRVELKDAVGNRAWSNFYLTGRRFYKNGKSPFLSECDGTDFSDDDAGVSV